MCNFFLESAINLESRDMYVDVLKEMRNVYPYCTLMVKLGCSCRENLYINIFVSHIDITLLNKTEYINDIKKKKQTKQNKTKQKTKKKKKKKKKKKLLS